MENLTRRKFSCNSNLYTPEHNNIMDELLHAYCLWTYKEGYEINYNSDGYYCPVTEEGLRILEHLANCDLIEEIRDDN